MVHVFCFLINIITVYVLNGKIWRETQTIAPMHQGKVQARATFDVKILAYWSPT